MSETTDNTTSTTTPVEIDTAASKHSHKAAYSSRKVLLTINNPNDNGYDDDILREKIMNMRPDYACYAREVAFSGTPHVHVFLYRNGPMRFTTVKRNFPTAHIDSCEGSCAEVRDYVGKTGKWADTPKSGTSVEGSFWEFGTCPENEPSQAADATAVLTAILEGQSTEEIITKMPKYLFKVDGINKARETIVAVEYMRQVRDVNVHYYYGPPGTNALGYIYGQYGYDNVYRVSHYGNRHERPVIFDDYNRHPVLVLDRFCAQIPIEEMIVYLTGNPLRLPARYGNKIACYKDVYILSEYSVPAQYSWDWEKNPGKWQYFVSLLSEIKEFRPDGTIVDHQKGEYIDE